MDTLRNKGLIDCVYCGRNCSALLAAMIILCLYPAKPLYALNGTFSGGNLGTVTVNINARPTGSAGGPYSGSSPNGGYKEKDWSPSNRASSESADIGELFKPISDLFTDAFNLIERSLKPIQDTIREIEERWRSERIQQQKLRITIQKWHDVASKSRRENQAKIWPGLDKIISNKDYIFWFEEARDESDCDDKEHKKLQNRVDASCDKENTNKCKGDDTCDVLLLKLTDRIACAMARSEIMRKCYPDRRGKGKNGDIGHILRYNEERKGIAKCVERILDPKKRPACIEEYKQRVSGLMKKIKARE